MAFASLPPMNTLLNWPNGRAASFGTLVSLLIGNGVAIAVWLHLWLIPDFPMPGKPIAMLVTIHFAAIMIASHAILSRRARSTATGRQMAIRAGTFEQLVAPAPAARLGLVVERLWHSKGNGGHRPWIGSATKQQPSKKVSADLADAILSEYRAD